MKKMNLERMEMIEGGKTCFGEGAAVLTAMGYDGRFAFEIYLLSIAALFDCLAQ